MAEEPAKPMVVIAGAEAGIPHGTVIQTPAGMPNVIVQNVSHVRRVTIRVLRIYVFSLLGMLTVIGLNVAPDVIVPPQEFWKKLVAAAGLAIAPSVYQLLTNFAEWLAKADA